MSTSDRKDLVRRAASAGALAAVIALVVSPGDPAMIGTVVHPAWLVALVLAARYGVRGLVAVPAVIAGVSLAELLAGHVDLAMLGRLEHPDGLGTLMAIAAIAWVGGLHEARKALLEARLRDADRRATQAEDDASELAEAALVLRDRGDRALTSLTFLADIAIEIDSQNPARAGQAALDLAVARTGARGGVVQLVDGARLRTLVARGAWSHDQVAAPSLFRDRVALAAVERRTSVAAHEVRDVRVEDSDLAAPLVGEDGTVHGVLALRGLAYPAVMATAREDLAAIARWAARSLARSYRDAGPAAQAERRSARALV
ncbi:MAG: hypothetical protein ACM31C_29105 [Acidobacteriota bacterium]